jgi:hypothetical protein
MADEIDPERIRIIAEAACVPLDATAPARIARAVAPTALGFATARPVIQFEAEPSTFAVVQRGGLDR